jgi:trehalose-6-phosphate synthase
MSDSQEFSGRTLIYSNRPPTAGASGGAQAVIEASNPTWWVGPETVRDKFWNVMDEEERQVHTLHGTEREEKASYDILTFATPQTLETAQYKTISNEILWPVAHSMQPNTDKTIEEIEQAYFDGYILHNELANVAIRKLVDEQQLTSDDRIWVHDYQCNNVPGAIFSNHIPWPSIDFLESVTFPDKKGEKVCLLDTNFYRDHIELMSGRALTTFQRAVDQANFLMTAAYVAGSSEHFALDTAHPELQNLAEDVRNPAKRAQIQDALLEEIGIGSVSKLTLFGDKISVINVPVGQVTSQTHSEAVENEHELNKTRFTQKNGIFSVFHAPIADDQSINLTASVPEQFDTHNPPLLRDLVAPIRGRDWVFSVHRNDYTKGTLTKLEAAEEVLAENSNATFLFILQPTRGGVAGYKEYAEQVFKKAAYLREKYGEKSVVILPEGIQHNDVMGLMRQPEMRGFMGLGHKDGHDLTVREMVDSNDHNAAIGVIASSGIGASDVLGDGNKGAFIINDPTSSHEVASALREILSPANKGQLAERFNFMKARSEQYDAANFSTTVDRAYNTAMTHRFGENWRETFQQPDGNYVDRKGVETEREHTRPEYIEKILLREIESTQSRGR